MSLRGLLLGNSHLAALRIAYARQPPAGLQLDFIASGQAGLADLAVQDGHLVATTPALQADLLRFGGVTSVPLAGYDFFVLVGLGFHLYGIEPLYRGFRCIGLQYWHVPHPRRQLVSVAMLRQMMVAQMQHCLSNRLAALLACAQPRPIYQHLQPRPGEVLLNLTKPFPALRRAARRPDGIVLSQIFEAAAPLACIGRYLPQPPQSIAMGLLTAAAFSAGSLRLTPDLRQKRPHPADDFLHANVDYGALALRQLAQTIYQDFAAPAADPCGPRARSSAVPITRPSRADICAALPSATAHQPSCSVTSGTPPLATTWAKPAC